MRTVLTPAIAMSVALLAIAALLIYTPHASAQIAVSSSANTEEYEYEWCPGVASTTYAGSPVSGSRALYIQNRSTATCYVRFDAQAVTTAGASGYRLQAGDSLSFDATHVFAGQMRGACTAATSTTGCLYTSWWK